MDPRIPIVIGTTGHRDLPPDAVASLSATVRRVLTELTGRYPNSPFLLLSALAEGADRLVAGIALESGIPIFVPLPMERTAYLATFESDESRREFDALAARAERVFVLHSADHPELPALPCPEVSAEELYGRLGTYLVEHSDVLMALWNGLRSELQGGTASVVGSMLDATPEDTAHHPVSHGLVYHVVTPRAGHPRVCGTAFDVVVRQPKGERARSASGRRECVLARKDRLNTDIRALAKSRPADSSGEPQRGSRSEPEAGLRRAAEALAESEGRRARAAVGTLVLAVAIALGGLLGIWLLPSRSVSLPLAAAGIALAALAAARCREPNLSRRYRALHQALRERPPERRARAVAGHPNDPWIESVLRTIEIAVRTADQGAAVAGVRGDAAAERDR